MSERQDSAEIEVTPEMIEAGLKELAYFDPSEDLFESSEYCVVNIYQTMRLMAERQG